MPLLFLASFVFCASSHVALASDTAQEAWNGRVDNSSPNDAGFTPFYVPDGSFSVDDPDPSVWYTPSDAWSQPSHPLLVGRSMHTTSQPGAEFVHNFTGVGIEWFGSFSPKHGIAHVFIDGDLKAKLDAYSTEWLKQQRLFRIDHLPHGLHSLRVVATGKRSHRSTDTYIDVDALVVNPGSPPDQGAAAVQTKASLNLPLLSSQDQIFKALSHLVPMARRAASWLLKQEGETLVNAMQLTVVSTTHAIVIDKVEHNPLTIDGRPAWGALYDLRNHQVRPLRLLSNSFCAGGTFLSNGTLLNVGGNPVVSDQTGAADFGDINGLQSVRLFHPELCDQNGNGCDVVEAPEGLRLATPRWYNSVLRLDDGSAMILGGSTRGGWMNNHTTNNPTFEFYPHKNIHGYNGMPLPSPFLQETLNSNLFPIAILLPDTTVFVAANRDAMIYDWKTNTERRLPQIPNGVRVTYPMTATATLLPLSSSNGWTPIVLICGGSTIDDTRPGYMIDSQEVASDQCFRMELTDAGITRGWEVETMPQPRLMADSILLPTGEVMIINGASSGIAGYGNVINQVGASNAANPAFTPVLYRPDAPLGERFSSEGMPTSDIPRLYHSSATLVPDGRIMVAGSNPNLDRSTREYGTEYRVEWLSPSWLKSAGRPTINNAPSNILYGPSFDMEVNLSGIPKDKVKREYFLLQDQPGTDHSLALVALMDLGFVTHSIHMNSRLVYLDFEVSPDSPNRLTVRSPSSSGIYPPGPGWLFLVVEDIWSVARQVMVGDGSSPPEDPGATANVLAHTGHTKNLLSQPIGGGEGDEIM